MVRAVFQNGQVRLTDPVPPRWREGQELSVSEPTAQMGHRVPPTRADFDRLTKQWKDETRASSSMEDEASHSAYQRIIGMGPVALPWIIDDLKRTNAHWFAALTAITGENPARDDSNALVEEQAADWVRWYESRTDWSHLYPDATELRARFDRLADRWKDETAHHSNCDRIVMNRWYQQMIGLGPAVVPLIIERLRQAPDYWFYALHALTGAEPIPHWAAGRMAIMAECWVRWFDEQQATEHGRA